MASIQVTLARYAQGTDNVDYNMLASTYAPDATLTTVAGGQTTQLEGRDAITAFFINARNTQGYVERHFLTGIVAERAPNGAALVHAYFLVVKEQDNAYTDIATGIYNDLMVRGPDDVWRIANENIIVDSALP